LFFQGGEKYQQAFYVFEELAQAPATSSVRTLVSQAVAELHLGRTEEAQAALEQALAKEPQYADAIANLLVLSVITGKNVTEQTKYVPSPLLPLLPLSNNIPRSLEKADAQHPFLVDLAEKNELFDKAATKYKARVAA
jgi:coatomer protein complex subunit epsilon